MTDTAPGRWVELATPRYAAPTATLCLGVALFAFNGFLVSTALPTAVGELRGVALISWSLTLYLVFAIVGGSSAALLKRQLGTRVALTTSAVVFLIGTLAAAGASSMAQVLAGRTLQGAGEGVTAAICYALIPELFPSRLVAKVFGAEAVVWAAAAFGGPLVSGALTETVSWRAAFLVNVPLAAIFIGLVALVVPAWAGAPSQPTVPALRLTAIGGGILLVSLAGIMDAPRIAAGLIGAAGTMLAAAVLVDRWSDVRLLPVDAFSLTTMVGTGLWVVLLMPMAQASTVVYLVLSLQQLWGYGPTVAGAIGALAAVSWSASAITVANVGSARTRRDLIRLGPALLAVGLAGVSVAFYTHRVGVLLIAQASIGGGFGVSWGFLSQTVMEAATGEERDRASALLPTVQSAGYAIGAAVAGLVAHAAGYATAGSLDGRRQAAMSIFAAAAGLATVSLIAAYRMTAPRTARERS